MELPEFLELLRKTPRKWTLEDVFGQCGAISFNGNKKVCPRTYLNAAPDDVNRDALYAAVDNAPGHNPALRAQLLAACGLEEQNVVDK